MSGVETRLKTITGLRTAPYIADQINPPQAVVHLPEQVTYNSTFKKGMMELDLTVTLLVTSTVDRVGQTALGTYMDAGGVNSVSLAVDGDRTLAGVVADCYVETSRVLSREEVAEIGYYGSRFFLKVLANGS